MKAAPGSDLARARQAAHRAFDPIWQNGTMTRSEAYAWLAKELDLKPEKCHMFQMDIATCHKVCNLSIAFDFE